MNKRIFLVLTVIVLTSSLSLKTVRAWNFSNWLTNAVNTVVETVNNAVNTVVETITNAVNTILQTLENVLNPEVEEEDSPPPHLEPREEEDEPVTWDSPPPTTNTPASSNQDDVQQSSQQPGQQGRTSNNLLSEPVVHHGWKMTSQEPGTNWFHERFNDSSWVSTSLPLTSWGGRRVWVRRFFQSRQDGVILTGAADDEATCYVNGHEIFGDEDTYDDRYPSNYWKDITSLVVEGDNVLACEAEDYGGLAYFSLTLEGEVEPVPEPVLNQEISVRDEELVVGLRVQNPSQNYMITSFNGESTQTTLTGGEHYSLEFSLTSLDSGAYSVTTTTSGLTVTDSFSWTNQPLDLRVTVPECGFVAGQALPLHVTLTDGHDNTTVTLNQTSLTTGSDAFNWVVQPVNGTNHYVFTAVDNVDGDTDSYELSLHARPQAWFEDVDVKYDPPFRPAPGDFVDGVRVASVEEEDGFYLLSLSNESNMVLPVGVAASAVAFLIVYGLSVRKNAAKIMRESGERFGRGAVFGEVDSPESFAGDVALSSIPGGDLRDIVLRVLQDNGYEIGNDVDDFTFFLSGVGLALDAGVLTGVGEWGNTVLGYLKAAWKKVPDGVRDLFVKNVDDMAVLTKKFFKVFDELKASGKIVDDDLAKVMTKYFDKVPELLRKGVDLDDANKLFVKGFDKFDEVVEHAAKHSGLTKKLGEGFVTLVEDHAKIIEKIGENDEFTELFFKKMDDYYDEIGKVPRIEWVETIEGGSPAQIDFEEGGLLQLALNRKDEIAKTPEYIVSHELMHPILEKKGINFFNKISKLNDKYNLGLDEEQIKEINNLLLDGVIDKKLMEDPKIAEQIVGYRNFEGLNKKLEEFISSDPGDKFDIIIWSKYHDYVTGNKNMKFVKDLGRMKKVYPRLYNLYKDIKLGEWV